MAGKKLLNRMEIKKKKRGWKTSRDRETFSQSVWKEPGVRLVSLCSVEQRIFFSSRSSPLIQPPKILLHLLLLLLKKPTNDEWCVRPGVSLSLPHEEISLPPSSIGGGKPLRSRKNLFFQVRMNPPSHRYPQKTDPPPSSPSSDIHYNPMYFSWPGESMNEKPKVSIRIKSTAITNAVHLNIKSWGDYRDGRDHYLQLCLCVCVWASIWM